MATEIQAAAQAVEQTTKVLGWEQLADKAMDKAGNVFEAVSRVISDSVSTYGPSVGDAVLWVIRIDHLQPLVYGMLVFLIGVIFWVVWGSRLSKHFNARGRDIEKIDFSVCLVTVLSSFVTLVFIIPFVYSTLFNIWNWTAVIKPELWIAKQIVVKIDNMANPSEKKK